MRRAIFLSLGFLVLLAAQAHSELRTSSFSASGGTVRSGYFRLTWTAEGLDVSLSKELVHLMRFYDRQPLLFEKGSLVPLVRKSLRLQKQKDAVAVTEGWDADRLSLAITYTLYETKPYFKFSIGIENKTKERLVVNYQLSPELDRSENTLDRRIIFHSNRKNVPLDSDASYTVNEAYSTYYEVEGFGNVGSRLAFPIICRHDSKTKKGIVFFTDARVPIGIKSTASEVTLHRKFFIPPGGKEQFVDFQEAGGKIPYDFYIGYVEKTSWARVFWEYYRDANSWMRDTPTVRLPRGGIGAGGSKLKITDDLLKMQLEYGLRLCGTHSYHVRNPAEKMVGGLDFQRFHNLGFQNVLSLGAIAEVKDTAANPIYKSEFDYRSFGDSIVTSPDRKPSPNWQGVRGNSAPEYSWAQFTYKKVEDEFAKYPEAFDLVFLDLYADGDGIDPNRSYQGYGYYPQRIAYTRYLKRLTDIVHATKVPILYNIPSPGLNIQNLMDVTAYDAPAEGPGFILKLQNAGIPIYGLLGPDMKHGGMTSLGWRNYAFKVGMFYGSQVSAWAWQSDGSDLPNNCYYIKDKDTDEARKLFSRNSFFSSYLGEAVTLDGDDESWFLYRHPEGHYLLALTSPYEKEEKVHLNPGDIYKFDLDPQGYYTIYRWDLDHGGTIDEPKISGAQILDRKFEVLLPPNTTYIYFITPYKPIIRTDFAAIFPDAGISTRYSTFEVVDAKVIAGKYVIEVRAFEGCKAQVALTLPKAYEDKIRVEGAASSAIQPTGEGTEVTMTFRRNNPKIVIG